ncbi:hypothetical protein A6R68_03154, partial [Neotoma lepida]
IKWEPDENGVIAFDCRNRKWYIQAATSPKDVVILVDVSGSMKGLRLTIAKQTVSSILDTLGDDDFFNIITYNEELHYVEPCLNGTLVQADRTNKEGTDIYDDFGAKIPKYGTLPQHFREHLDKLFAKGIGMLDIALNEAFNILSDAIMLITDGAVDTYDTIFAKYNWPDRKGPTEGLRSDILEYFLGKIPEEGPRNRVWPPIKKPWCHKLAMLSPKTSSCPKSINQDAEKWVGSDHDFEDPTVMQLNLKVRIFTYLIGREAAFADNLKWMACANKGFFTQISTLADVQENVMEYLHVLSRPKVIDQEHDVVWTEAYIDS